MKRNGISLLEVLISMFVLLIGLVGVGAMIPAGRFEILQGVKMDYAAMVGRGAFRDLKVRGYLKQFDNAGNPNWLAPGSSNSTIVWTTSSPPFSNPVTVSSALSVPVILDPLGCAFGFGNKFPPVASVPATLAMVRIYPYQTATQPPPPGAPPLPSRSLADPIFRCPDDLNLLPATSKDFPPSQQMTGASNAKRASQGNYSWLATIVPDANPNVSVDSSKMIVSVAVIYKRDLSTGGASEGAATVTSFGGTGEAILGNLGQPLRPGQWIMLAGTQPAGTPVTTWTFYRWYRVVAADATVPAIPAPGPYAQAVTLAGPDWLPAASSTYVFIIDNVIAVYEKNLKLEIP